MLSKLEHVCCPTLRACGICLPLFKPQTKDLLLLLLHFSNECDIEKVKVEQGLHNKSPGVMLKHSWRM